MVAKALVLTNSKARWLVIWRDPPTVAVILDTSCSQVKFERRAKFKTAKAEFLALRTI